MLCTSYFAKSAKHPGAVSIARFPPGWFTGRCYPALAPKPEMLRIGNWDKYRHRYRNEILLFLDPDDLLQELGVEDAGHDIVLLCFEKDRTLCHRGLVAEWFLETKGITVPELGCSSVQRTL